MGSKTRPVIKNVGKILEITNCSKEGSWYEGKVGERFVISGIAPSYRSYIVKPEHNPNGSFVKTTDCNIIEE